MSSLPRKPASKPPVVCITGESGSGKTTLIVSLILEMRARGLRVAALKHASHGFSMDRPGKDTWRLKEAGARDVAAVGGGRVALIADADAFGTDLAEPDPSLLASHLFRGVDLVLAEGFSFSSTPRVEVWGEEISGSRGGAGDLLAVVARHPKRVAAFPSDLPLFDADEPRALAEFLLTKLSIASPASARGPSPGEIRRIVEAERAGEARGS